MMSSQPLQSTSTNEPQSLLKKLTIKDLANLQNILYKTAPKAFDFGLQLGVEYPTLSTIQQNYGRVQDQFREVLAHRLSQLPPLTWHDVLQALRSNVVQMGQLASEIESQYLIQPSVSAFSLVSCTHTLTAPSPPTVSHATLQSNPSTPNAQPHPPPQPAPQVFVHVDSTSSQPLQPLPLQLHLPQQPSCPPPPNPLTPTPSQPQAETAQPPSSSQPSSSQLMSVPVTSQAMPGPSPQLSQDVATPHHLQVGEQQALQGQPPLQHTPSHEPQTLDQSYGIGYDNGPSQAKRGRYESTMAQYVRFIKAVYRSSKVERDPKVTKWPQTPSTVYIDLVYIDQNTHVSKKEADECTRAMVEDGNVDVILRKKRSIGFSDIAKDIPTSGKKVVLVVGAPGVGKSTSAWEFCRRWERGEIAQQYQLVLLLRLRDERMSKAESFSDLIHHPSKVVAQAVENEIISTLGANTLIILEGYDELPNPCRIEASVFLQIINGELLPHATVLITSRPWATQDLHKKYSHRIFQHIEILGFTGKQIENYVISVFKDEGKPLDDKARESTKEVMLYIKTYPQIKACMYIPLNSAIVVSVYQESKAGKCILPKTLTQLYYALTQTLLLRYLYGHPEYGQRRWKIQSLKEDLPKDVYSELLAISELAYSGMSSDQGDTVQLIYTDLPPGFETLGLMQSVPQLYVTQGEDMSHNFLHLTVQEFLAALHISNMSPEKQLEHFQRQEEGRLRVVLKFLAGLTQLANVSMEAFRVLLVKIPNEDQITNESRYNMKADVVLRSQHVQWMFETQRDDIIPLVLQEDTVEFISTLGMTALDCYSLGYCIAHSHSQWVLLVLDVIGKEEVRMLLTGAKTRPDTAARVVGLRGGERYKSEGGGYCPLSMSAEALNLMFTGLQDVIYLQELHLKLPVECSSITWPNLSGLLVLRLTLEDGRNWKLDTLLPHLLLESLTIEGGGDNFDLDNVASIQDLILSSRCPTHVYVDITHKWPVITTVVSVDQHTHDKQMENRVSAKQENKFAEFTMRCCLDGYSLGCIMAYNHFQWVLSMEKSHYQLMKSVEKSYYYCGMSTGTEEKFTVEQAQKLVDGANTSHNTTARVVGMRGGERNECEGGGYSPLSLSGEALHVLFTGLQNMLHLQELHLELPVECCSITWPDLSGLRVLHVAISGKRNWRLDTLLPHLSLESLTIEAVSEGATLVHEDSVAIGMLLSSSDCLKCLHFHAVVCNGVCDDQNIKSIIKAMSNNVLLPLKSLKVECRCTFSDTAAHSLTLFITNSTILHHLSIDSCTFSACGLLKLAQAIHQSSSLLERELQNLTCTVDGDDEAASCAQLLLDYPHTVHWLDLDYPLQWLHISDEGAQSIATALYQNSTLEWLDLSNSSISDTGSAALAQALHHNSTLWELNLSNNSISDIGSGALAQALHHNSTLMKLDLSGNDAISAEGTHQLVQALTVNTSICKKDGYDLVLPRRCEEYATLCPQYSAVKKRIKFQ